MSPQSMWAFAIAYKAAMTEYHELDDYDVSSRLAALNFVEEVFITLTLSTLAFVYFADVTNALFSTHHLPHFIFAPRKILGQWFYALVLAPVQMVSTGLPLGILIGILFHRYAIRYAIFIAAVATFSMWGVAFGDPQGVVISLLVTGALIFFAHWASRWRVSRVVESLWHRPHPSVSRFAIIVASDLFLMLNFLANAVVWRNVLLRTGNSAEYDPYVLRFAVLNLLLAVLFRAMVWARGRALVLAVTARDATRFA